MRARQDELDIAEIDGMFSNPLFRDVIHVYLTGGEPFLNGKIVDVCKVVKNRLDATISLNTNGLLPENVERYGRQIRDLGLDILSFDLSINGPDWIHDYTRGINGGFKRLMLSRDVLEKLGIPYGWTFTIFKNTVPYVSWFRDFRLGEPKTYAFGTSIKFLNSPDRDMFNLTGDEVDRVYVDCDDVVLRGYLDLVKSGVKYFNPCSMGSRQVRIDPMGEMYLCDYVDLFKLGGAKTTSLEDYAERVSKVKRHCPSNCNLESCIYGFNKIMSNPRNKIVLHPFIYRKLRKTRLK
jgi:MoaA/NifB/PqqE/SkfB family radical SAM enzyme